MSAIIEFTVDELNSGRTVERILRSNYNISSSMLKHLKLCSGLFLNGNVCRTVDVCQTGDFIVADVSENIEKPANICLWNFEPEILFDDDFLTVVNKPGGMEVHPCPSNRTTTLANAIMYYWSKFGEYHNYHIVNRLDKDTSGICVIAKNRFAHGVLSAQMNNNTFKREYTAIVHGSFESAEGTVELPIGRDPDSIIKRIVSPGGRYAKTNYWVKNNTQNGFSTLKIQLETGRTHQIRVHFSQMGHPLVGDWLYGSGDNERNLIKRHALHADYVEFIHPVSKSLLSFKSPLPEDMKNL